MRKIILTAIIALVSNIAFCQQNIKFQIHEETEKSLCKNWDYQYKKFYSSSPCYILFNKEELRMGSEAVEYFREKIVSIKKIEKKETIYGNEVITNEKYIIGTDGEHCIEYFILNRENLQKGGSIYTLSRPIFIEGELRTYHIYRSSKIF